MQGLFYDTESAYYSLRGTTFLYTTACVTFFYYGSVFLSAATIKRRHPFFRKTLHNPMVPNKTIRQHRPLLMLLQPLSTQNYQQVFTALPFLARAVPV